MEIKYADTSRVNAKMSNFEQIAYDFLIRRTFVLREYSTDSLRGETGSLLYFDFFCPDAKYVVEINGLHHYREIKGKEQFERQKKNDQAKRDWCKKNGFSMIEFDISKGKDHLIVELCKVPKSDTVKNSPKYIVKRRPKKKRKPTKLEKRLEQYQKDKDKKDSRLKNVNVNDPKQVEKLIKQAEERGRKMRESQSKPKVNNASVKSRLNR
jgi:hypothetical protein